MHAVPGGEEDAAALPGRAAAGGGGPRQAPRAQHHQREWPRTTMHNYSQS